MKTLWQTLVLVATAAPNALPRIACWLLGRYLVDGGMRILQLRSAVDPDLVSPAPGSWLASRWPYSTTLGHVVLMHPAHRDSDRVIDHELVHVYQFEAVCVTWLAITLLTQSFVLLCLWPLAWPLVYLSASLWPLLTGGHWYRDNPFERHARAESGT